MFLEQNAVQTMTRTSIFRNCVVNCNSCTLLSYVLTVGGTLVFVFVVYRLTIGTWLWRSGSIVVMVCTEGLFSSALFSENMQLYAYYSVSMR